MKRSQELSPCARFSVHYPTVQAAQQPACVHFPSITLWKSHQGLPYLADQSLQGFCLAPPKLEDSERDGQLLWVQVLQAEA